MPNIRLTIPVTPPGTMGTTQGGHIYLEAPDVSASATARMDGVTIMDGSYVAQADWAPIDLGKVPYVAVEQPWVLDLALPDGINPRVVNSLRVYVSSYSDAIDTPLVRYGEPGATPSVVVSLAAAVAKKPASATHVTPHLVTSVSATVDAAVTVSGKLRRPISVTTDLSGMGNRAPANWGYQLLGYVNGDLTTDPVLASGIITDTAGGLIPAGPDGISTAHTFGPEEPTAVTSITIYAVAGIIASDRYTPRGSVGLGPPGTFTPNNIVPGITASCVVTIGTTTGVSDPTAFIAALLSSVFGNVGGLFDVTALAIDQARIALLAIDTGRLANLAATAAKLASGSVTAANGALGGAAVVASNMATNSITAANAALAALAVGTAAIQTLAVTTALIANQAVGTAQIANLAVGDAQISSLSVAKLTAGTISVAVSLTSPTITAVNGTTTLTISATAVSGAAGMSIVNTATSYTAKFLSVGMQVINVVGGIGSLSGTYQEVASFSYPGGFSSSVDAFGLVVNGVRVAGAISGTRPVTLADVINQGVTKGWWV